MQAVALVLIAAVTNHWALPESENSTQSPTAETVLDDRAVIADHRAQLERSARQQPAPTARTIVNPFRTREGVRPADHQQRPDATDNVRLAQYVEEDAWPTAGVARSADDASVSVDRRSGLGTPDLFGEGRDEDPYTSAVGTQFDVRESGANASPNAVNDPFNSASQPTGFSADTRRPQQVAPQAATQRHVALDIPAFEQPGVIDSPPGRQPQRVVRQAQAQLDGGATVGSNAPPRNAQAAPKLQDLYGTNQSPISAAERGAPTFQTEVANPATTPGSAPRMSGDMGRIENQRPSDQSPRLGQSTDQSAETTNQLGGADGRGNPLLLLVFFASVGLNFYLGWIAWDTYNRYQDMVSDLRYSGASARRDRSERDSVERRSDRRLVESAY